MEKKTERIKFWLTDKELKQIDRKAKKLRPPKILCKS